MSSSPKNSSRCLLACSTLKHTQAKTADTARITSTTTHRWLLHSKSSQNSAFSALLGGLTRTIASASHVHGVHGGQVVQPEQRRPRLLVPARDEQVGLVHFLLEHQGRSTTELLQLWCAYRLVISNFACITSRGRLGQTLFYVEAAQCLAGVMHPLTLMLTRSCQTPTMQVVTSAQHGCVNSSSALFATPLPAHSA